VRKETKKTSEEKRRKEKRKNRNTQKKVRGKAWIEKIVKTSL